MSRIREWVGLLRTLPGLLAEAFTERLAEIEQFPAARERSQFDEQGEYLRLEQEHARERWNEATAAYADWSYEATKERAE